VELASPPFPNISSTTVRERLAAGLPINHLVTKSVLPLVLEDYKATR
jgi:nicotinic acid mononucleotide adenylyltransferase